MGNWQFWAGLIVSVLCLVDVYWTYSGHANQRLLRRGRQYSARAARFRITGLLLMAFGSLGLTIEWAMDRRLEPVTTLRVPLLVIGLVLALGPWGLPERVAKAPAENADGKRPSRPSVTPTLPRGNDATGAGASGERVRILKESEKASLAGLAPPATDAGWYPDPFEPDGSRYWNGDQWTGRTRLNED